MLYLSTRDFMRYLAIPCLLYSIFFFGGSELIEHLFLNRVSEPMTHFLHFIRGVFSVFFVAAMVVFSLSRAERGFNGRMEAICSLLSAANEGLIAFDSSCHVVSMNHRAREFLGSTYSGDFAQWTRKIRPLLETGNDFECANPSGDRRLRVVALQSYPGGFLLLVHDASEEKKVEEHWLITEKMASVGRMAAGLAHEIGTPLNIISGRAELIDSMQKNLCGKCELKNDCGMQKHISIIFQQIERISGIIHQLLTQASEPTREKEIFSLNDCVRKVVEFLQPVFDKKEIPLELDLGADLPDLYGFADQLQQVLINLITNSLDAMEQRSGGVRIRTRSDNGNLLLFVADDGSGIPETNLIKVFDPFFTTKEFGKGTGLGLTVTANIVRAHGGVIDVQSKPNQGTIFTIRLPAIVPGARLSENAGKRIVCTL